MKKSKRIKENKAVTLIALVVTIVVLIILAGISISALTGDKGIINQAKASKEDTEIASWEEQIDLAIIDAEKKYRTPTLDNIKEELKNKGIIDDYNQVSGKGVITTNEPVYEIVGKLSDYLPFEPGVIAQRNEQYTDSNGNQAIIPEGFIIVPGLDNIEKGLVISDSINDKELSESEIVAEGNQFVWVPVPVFNEFKRYDFKNDKELSSDYIENSGNGITVDKGASESIKEAQEMYKSVNENKGFYIGRYEAGNEGDKVISKKGVNPYINIGWNLDGTIESETGGAVEKARSFDTQSKYTSVTSTLVYGVQWDAVMKWLSNGTTEEKSWINATGLYIGNINGETKKTGNSYNYQIKHIYDLLGNVEEWTMEAHSTYRVTRGGSSAYGVASYCSMRYDMKPNSNLYHTGFRIALYL